MQNQWTSGVWPFAIQTPASVGANMNHASFPYAQFFPGLYNEVGAAPMVDYACALIEVEWAGIFQLWQNDSATLQAQKQFNLEAYLVAWWLTDMLPEQASGVQGDGGMPLTSKSIGGVSVTRKDMGLQAGMKQLESNAFGIKAAHLFMSAPERMIIAQAQPNNALALQVPLVFPGWPQT
jgi:hypothetical protein